MGADLYHALASENLDLHDGFTLMEEARKIKTPEEIVLMRCAIEASEKGIRAMRENLRPGITENALWAKLHEANIAEGVSGSRPVCCRRDRAPIPGCRSAP